MGLLSMMVENCCVGCVDKRLMKWNGSLILDLGCVRLCRCR